MDFAANTCIIAQAGRTLATVEAGPLPYELTYELGTVGSYDFASTLPGGFAAHTKLDNATGELHAIAYFWAWDHVQHVIVGADGKVARTTDIPVPDGPMMHDFALTGKYLVLLDLPVTFSMNAVTEGKELPYVWNPGHQARVGLLPRDGSAGVRWIEIEPCWVFHCLNAYDDGDKVVVDLCQYNQGFDVSTLWAAHGPVTLDRWVIDPAAGKVAQQRLDDRGQEFPRIDDRIISRPHRYGYSAVIGEVVRAITWPAISATTLLPTPSSSTTWRQAPCRPTSSAKTPPSAKPSSLLRPPTPPKTTATSWRSSTTPTEAPLTWSSSPPRTSRPTPSPVSTCPRASRSVSTATGSPTADHLEASHDLDGEHQPECRACSWRVCRRLLLVRGDQAPAGRGGHRHRGAEPADVAGGRRRAHPPRPDAAIRARDSGGSFVRRHRHHRSRDPSRGGRAGVYRRASSRRG